jgi:pimeloyl-ACP methyl ester carboxylesterase
VSNADGRLSRGPSWLLLHGTPLTPAAWQDTAAHLDDQPVLVPDCTRVSQVDAQLTLAAEVARQLGRHAVDVVGHSFGGQVAIELALLRPRQVRSLTLVCSRDTPFPAFAQTAEAVRRGTAPTVAATLARWFTVEELRADGAAVRFTRSALETASPPDWAAALDAIAAYDRSDRTSELPMPVTLLAAGRDTVSTPAVMQELADRIPRGHYQLHPGWMHMSPFVDPSALAGTLVAARDRAIDRSRP